MRIDVKRVKIFVTVPIDDVEKVREAVCEAGAGVIGNYSYCTRDFLAKRKSKSAHRKARKT